MFDKISKRLKEIVTVAGIQQAYDFEASDLEGFPALTITPSENSNEYSTTTENRRVYAFVVRLYVERLDSNNAANQEHQAETTMRQLVDSVLNAIDRNYNLSGIQSETGYEFIKLDAAPSRWGYAGRENNMRVAEIRIQVTYYVDINTII